MAPVSLASGVGVANLPNQRHKIVAKRGANFTIMVCGKLHHLENAISPSPLNKKKNNHP
jgi:septin family protein